MTLNSFTPNRLQVAKAGIAATAITTAAAISAGVVAPYAAESLAAHREVVSMTNDLRKITEDIKLAAVSNKTVGLYTDGALFQILGLFGLGDPVSALKALSNAIGAPGLSDAVSAFVDVLVEFGPVDVKQTTSYTELYSRVNGLGYSSDALANLIGISPSDPIYTQIKAAAGPMINQRRAVIVTESTGGTDAARALRKMIDVVQVGSATWGGDPAKPTFVNPGVTAIAALMVRNPSRPNGGVWNLINPFMSLFGVDLMNPDLVGPNYGSFISRDRKQVLNISFTDVAYKYDWVSDIPNSINPFSWLNTAVGALMPTYLVPDKDYMTTAAIDLGKQLAPAGVDAATAIVDPSGGVGLALVPNASALLNILYQLSPSVWGPFIETFKQPGNANYVMYDSGNLPLVEPLAVIPRLLSYTFGINLPTPITNALTTLLRPIVDAGYNDAKVVYGVDGTPSLVRTGDLGGVPTDFLRSPLTTADSFRMPQIVFNAAMQAISNDLLSPENLKLNIGGLDLSGIYNNVVTLTIAHALRGVVENIRQAANPGFNAISAALDPLAKTLDQLQTTINQTRYNLDNQLRGVVGASPAETPNPAPGSAVLQVSPRGAVASRPAESVVSAPAVESAPAEAAVARTQDAPAVTAPGADKAPSAAAAVAAPVADKAPVEVPKAVVDTPAPVEVPKAVVDTPAPVEVPKAAVDTPAPVEVPKAARGAREALTPVRDAVRGAVKDVASAIGGGASSSKDDSHGTRGAVSKAAQADKADASN